MAMNYRHTFYDGKESPLPVGKVVCVGRNYHDHIKELNNPVPATPMFFIKPATSLVPIHQRIVIPSYSDNCHHETELAVLIGKDLTRASLSEAESAIAGFAIALDLTLRDVQQRLKEKGHPWEIAKGFDGACPISPFLERERLKDPQDTRLKLMVNGKTRQDETTKLMITKILDLLSIASSYFTLKAGDIFLTGTPGGVKQLRSGDRLELELAGRYRFNTSVR